MKILYSGYIKNLASSPGVVKKMIDIENSAKKKNIDLNVIFFTSSEIPEQYKNKSIFILRDKFSINWHPIFLHSLYKVAEKSGCTHLILRHSGFSPFFPIIFKERRFRLISEHNTLELPEYRINRNYPFLLSEFLSQKKSFKCIDAIIAATNEIAEYEIKRSGIIKDKVVVITNGVDYDTVPFTPARPYSGDCLDLLFIGSKIFPWAGIDRIFRGLNKNNVNVCIHLVGTIDLNSIPPRVNKTCKIVRHGKTDKENIDKIFKSCNLAISSLGIHRNLMREACPLKSREYCARGMPFIYAYHDPDLDGQKCLKKFSLNDDPIYINEIIDFVKDINEGNFIQTCRDFRHSMQYRIDTNYKISSIMDFVKNA